jgi:GAF domain-containing protein
MSTRKKVFPAMTQPTGYVHTPVCVDDLPQHDFNVSPATLTEEITARLEAHPELPGVILCEDNQKMLGIIPRKRIFERLAHRYGVELFLRKPIGELHGSLVPQIFTVHPHTRIDDAVYLAMDRPLDVLYEPLVVVSDSGHTRMLDFHTLLLAQSQILSNMNNLFSNLNRIEFSLKQQPNMHDSMTMILSGLRQVVPYHHAAILPKNASGLHLSDHEITTFTPTVPILQNAIYQSVLRHNQPLYIEDVKKVAAWGAMDSISDLRTWVGVPLRNGNATLGILSLGRRTLSPFSKDEMAIADTFGGYISQTLIQNGLS